MLLHIFIWAGTKTTVKSVCPLTETGSSMLAASCHKHPPKAHLLTLHHQQQPHHPHYHHQQQHQHQPQPAPAAPEPPAPAAPEPPAAPSTKPGAPVMAILKGGWMSSQNGNISIVWCIVSESFWVWFWKALFPEKTVPRRMSWWEGHKPFASCSTDREKTKHSKAFKKSVRAMKCMDTSTC